MRSKTDWKRVDALSDEDIDTSDIPEITPEQIKTAKTNAEHQAAYKTRMNAAGFFAIKLWVHKDDQQEVRKLEKKLQKKRQK